MTDVFISYAREWEADAEAVERALRSAGYSVWRDNALPVHRPYGDVIEEHLTLARAVVVLWSEAASRSEWVRSEADKARKLGKLVQATLDLTLPPMPFDQLQCADLRGGPANTTGWNRVLESVAHLHAAPRPPDPPAADQPASGPAGAKPRERLLAVLPFDNLSGDPDFTFFSDGVADEILHVLTKTTDIKIVARSSSFQLRGAQKSPATVVAELNASHLLDGTVRRAGDRVRITAELVDCLKHERLWGERYDKSLSDILALQDEVAEAVAIALKSAFAPRAIGSVNPVAYDLYLRARQMSSDRILFDAQLLEDAVAIDPDFAPAWESLALTHAVFGRFTTTDPAAVAAYRTKMDFALAHVLTLNPLSTAARYAKLQMMPTCGAFAEMEQLSAEALSLAPGELIGLSLASSVAATVGRLRAALAYGEQAYFADRLNPITVGWYAALLATNDRWREAMMVFDESIERWPNDGFIRTTALGKDIEIGDWETFERHVARPGVLGVYQPWFEALAASGRELRDWTPDVADRWLATERGMLAATRNVRLSAIGHLARHGLREEVHAMIDQASFANLYTPDGRPPIGDATLAVLFEPVSAVLRQDARFVRLCARLGFCDFWLKTQRWPDCADEVTPLYDFRAEARAQADLWKAELGR